MKTTKAARAAVKAAMGTFPSSDVARSMMVDLIDDVEELEAHDLAARKALWLGHGHTIGLYGDDGEMQCAECRPAVDYKRAPLEDLVVAALVEVSVVTTHAAGTSRRCEMVRVSPGEDGMGVERPCLNEAAWLHECTVPTCDECAAAMRAEGFELTALRGGGQ